MLLLMGSRQPTNEKMVPPTLFEQFAFVIIMLLRVRLSMMVVLEPALLALGL